MSDKKPQAWEVLILARLAELGMSKSYIQEAYNVLERAREKHNGDKKEEKNDGETSTD